MIEVARMTLLGLTTIVTCIAQVPVFQRGGSIVPKRERIRRSAALMHNDPITLVGGLKVLKMLFNQIQP